EAPADAGHNNVYDVIVSATDNTAPPVTQAVTVTVTDVANEVNDGPTGLPKIQFPTSDSQTLAADTSGIQDLDGLGTFHFQWEHSSNGGVSWTPLGTDTNTLQVSPAVIQDGDIIDVKVSYTDGGDTAESLRSTAV